MTLLFHPVPTAKVAFSSSVIALRTSSILSLVSLGCALIGKAIAATITAKKIFFIINLLFCYCPYLGADFTSYCTYSHYFIATQVAERVPKDGIIGLIDSKWG